MCLVELLGLESIGNHCVHVCVCLLGVVMWFLVLHDKTRDKYNCQTECDVNISII